MVQYRRRRSFRKPGLRRGRGGVKKVVTSPSKAIMSLTRQVKSLQKKTAVVMEKDVYQIAEAIDCGQPYVVRNLCNYVDWQKMWASTSSSASAIRSRMIHRYFTLDNLVTLDNTNNEEGTVNFTYFIVSRKDSAGSATDSTNALTLTSGVDYIVGGGDAAGIAYMNLKKWKVHYVKRFTLTGGDLTDIQADQMQKRFRCYVKVNKTVENPDGSWNTLTNSPDPSDTYYAILFNNNGTVDLENPRWSFNAIHGITH